MLNVLITGASSGIGRATALELARSGHRVFATMRNPERSSELDQIARREGLPIEILRLDVDSDASVKACFETVAGPIDVLVNNAGIGPSGSVEELPMQVYAAMINTNYLGAVRCIKAALPRMRQARAGCIINVSSVAGRTVVSPLGGYSASKFALEAISEALAGEVRAFNIRVAIVEPGIQDTKMSRSIVDTPPSLYPQVRRTASLFRAALATPVGPEATADLIKHVIESGTWQLRHPAGPDAAELIAWRAGMSDERWIETCAQDDESWYRDVQSRFGLDARPSDG
jgi:NAD(P)-dependent dehydrogenase (short-subunit alcohol dehydrogenase family)